MHRSQDLSTKISQEPHPVRGVPERETGAKMSYCHHASLCASIVTFDKEDQSEVACRIEEARTGRDGVVLAMEFVSALRVALR